MLLYLQDSNYLLNKVVLLMLSLTGVGCNDIDRPPVWTILLASGRTEGSVGVVSSDFGSAGRFSVITPDLIVSPNYKSIHSDAVAYYQQEQVYVVNRLNADSIHVLDPDRSYATTGEYSAGEATNPQAIQVTPEGNAFISLYNTDYLLEVDASTGVERNRIGLAEYVRSTGVSDGNPEASGLALVGDSLFIALQNLDRNSGSGYYPPSGESLLLEVDPATGAITGSYRFPVQNPFGKIQKIRLDGSDKLVFTCPGKMGFISELDGGIVAFDISRRTFQAGLLYDEKTANGDIIDAVIKSNTVGYAYVLDSQFNKTIQKFNPSTGEKLDQLSYIPASGGVVSGMLLAPSGRLFIADARFEQPGVMVYDTDNGDARITNAPIDTGLRPADLVYIH